MSAPYYADASVTLHHGDCLDVLRSLPDASVDAVVTDPPYGLEFMGREWDGADGFRRSLNPADAGRDNPFGRTSRTSPEYRAGSLFQEWCEAWTRECLRVLKPGGHLLAFGGTRTWHRLACAVEDAGFEVRDSIAWMYGSGFPKSLDVSKAIDKAAGVERVGLGVIKGAASSRTESLGVFAPEYEATAPATPDAERWQGWGTALKPAFEPVVVARKPLASPGINVLSMVESGLRERGLEGEIRWTTRPASGAAKSAQPTSSSSTEARSTGATSAAPADASETPSDERPTVSDSATSTPHGERPTASTSAPTPDAGPQSSGPKSSPHTAAPAPAATSGLPTSSPSTTSTAGEPRTERRPGGRSTSRSSARDSLAVTESFAGIATGLTGSWATVRIDRMADGTCVWPDGLPRNTAGGSTVAGNVLAHGTGALNVDGCRVASDEDTARKPAAVRDTSTPFGRGMEMGGNGSPLGRWPANVILDESQAAALDEQSGESVTPSTVTRGAQRTGDSGLGSLGRQDAVPCYGDSGGASRFFYVAKADASERVRVNGTAHPTVKPLSLMRWLVRLVTPPGGTVLEPFAGSGTTVEAALLEGFHCIAIEREADYLPLIEARIARRRDPIKAVELSGEDRGLFDLLEGDPA